MNNIEILKKAISKKHPCDKCHEALSDIERDLATHVQILTCICNEFLEITDSGRFIGSSFSEDINKILKKASK